MRRCAGRPGLEQCSSLSVSIVGKWPLKSDKPYALESPVITSSAEHIVKRSDDCRIGLLVLDGNSQRT